MLSLSDYFRNSPFNFFFFFSRLNNLIEEDLELPTRRENVDPTVASATAAAAAAAAAMEGVAGGGSSGGSAAASSHLSGSSLHTPPRRLILTMYERSFFSDSKLGELDLPLTALTDDRYGHGH